MKPSRRLLRLRASVGPSSVHLSHSELPSQLDVNSLRSLTSLRHTQSLIGTLSPSQPNFSSHLSNNLKNPKSQIFQRFSSESGHETKDSDHTVTVVTDNFSKSSDSEEIKKDLESNNVVISDDLVLSVLGKLESSPDVARRFFDWISENQERKLSSKSYNLMLRILGANGFVNEFWDLFEAMKKKKGYGISRDVRDNVLERLEKEGLDVDVQKLRGVFDSGSIDKSESEHANVLFLQNKKLSKTEIETEKDQLIEKKRKTKKEQNVSIVQGLQIPTQDNAIKTGKKKKGQKSPKKQKVKHLENKSSESNQLDNENDNGFNEENGRSKKARKKEKEQNSLKESEKSADIGDADQNEVFHVPAAAEGRLKRKKGKSKEAKKKKRKDSDSSKDAKSQENEGGADEGDVYLISSGDEDSSKGMKKWITEYQQNRPGLTILQQRIDEFITAHEEKLEQERKEREARAAEGGWTVVTHHKGRKKTTDAESGVTIGSVAQAVVEGNLAKKKSKEVGLDFYRFQRKEAQRNELMILQSKFEQDKKRIQQFRAARKFRPY